MKKHLSIFLLILMMILPVCATAQAPEGFNFQAVIRNELGALATNQVVSVRLSITSDADGNNVIYSENHSVRTNSQGLVTFVVGQGSNPSSVFGDINWNDGYKFVKVEVDVNGGFDFKLVSVSQILSVPYAMSARTAETVTGNISYSQITDVPVVEGFSGNYDDLTGKPDLFSGDYNDLQNLPLLFSGSYNDLTGKPAIADSVRRYSFSGSYNDLTDKPALFSGSYNDLTDVPANAGFSGRYSDLSGTPQFRTDSLPVWNGLLDYNLLQNKPNLSADGSFSGSYNDLSDKPDINAIASNIVTSAVANVRYSDLKSLPSFPDSIAYYSNKVDYRKVSNLPNLRDTVEKYSVSESGTYDYNELENKPNIVDSISRYSFSGNYLDLANRPNIKDSVKTYGFSGRYEDLEGRPIGSRHGELLYWNSDTEEWTSIEPGSSGYILMANVEGKPKWINPAYVMKNVENTQFRKIRVANYPVKHVNISDEMGLMHNGELEVPVFEDVVISFETENEFGIKNITLNGDTNYYVESGNGFVEFTVDSAVTEYVLDVTLESDTVFFTNQYVIDTDSGDSIVKTIIDTVLIGYGKTLTYAIPNSVGYGFEDFVSDNVNFESISSALNQIKVSNVVGNASVVLTYRAGLYSIGDTYLENGKVAGIIYAVSNRGTEAKVVNIESLKTNVSYQWNTNASLYTLVGASSEDDGLSNQSKGGTNPIFVNAASYGDGWYLPAVNELEELNNVLEMIEATLKTYGVQSLNGLYWSSTEINNYYSYLFDFGLNSSVGIDKAAMAGVIAVKKITKK